MREAIEPDQAAHAARRWWNQAALEYRREHHAFLEGALRWGPEGWCESELQILGKVAGLRVLDLGCGQGESTAWLAAQGANVVGVDISESMLAFGAQSRVCADARALPFVDGAFDLVVSAYGALPFIADLDTTLQEIYRLSPRLVFSVTHPMRWSFADDPDDFCVRHSYFDRTPYIERDSNGAFSYSEHHRTIGDWVDLLIRNGFHLDRLLELEWKAGNDQIWGGWSPQRGRQFPGTMIVAAQRK